MARFTQTTILIFFEGAYQTPLLTCMKKMPGSIDVRGKSIHGFKKVPTRIVSVVPSQTELLYHLGLDNEVVGITKFCVHPQKWFRSKTRIGGTKNIDTEKLKRLQPDLVLANKEENEKDQIEEIAAFCPVWVTDVSNLNQALEMIKDVGFLTSKNMQATFLKAHITQAFHRLQPEKTKKMKVCYLIWKEPYVTVGGDTFIHAMLEQACFENLFAQQKRYPQIELKQLKTMHCDALLLSSEPYPFSEKHIAGFQALLPNTKIILVDGELFSWYGSRLQWAPDYFINLQKTFFE